MKLNQFINLSQPVAYWSGDSYDSTTVFDAVASGDLDNSGAILGQVGSGNRNLAERSINLNGGHLKVLDATFAEANLSNRQLIIAFGLMVESPVSGFHPVVGKWAPDMQYMVGFENGGLVAKVNTSVGLVEFTFPHNEIVYSGRFNWVTLRITPSIIEFGVNSIVESIADTSPTIGSSSSLFTIGGVGTEVLGSDVWVNDICVLADSSNQHFVQASYVLTRTERDIWLDAAPTHYFPVGDLNEFEVTQPLVNYGTAGGFGYFCYNFDQPTPTVIDYWNRSDRRVISMQPGTYLTIDQTLQFDMNNGITVAYRGEHATKVNTLTNHVIAEFAESNGSNIERLTLNSLFANSSNYLRHTAYDGSGAVISNISAINNTYRIIGDEQFSVRSVAIDSNSIDLVGQHEWNYSANYSTYDMPILYNNTIPLNYNQWIRIDHSEYYLADFALFGYKVPQRVIQNVNHKPFVLRLLFMHGMQGSNGTIGGFGYYPPGSNQLNFYNGSPFLNSVGLQWAYDVIDPNYIRQNTWTTSAYLETTSNWTGNVGASFFNIGTGDFTSNMFIWNRNVSTRYLLMDDSSSSFNFDVWMNSRAGAYSPGDIEFSTNAGLTNYTVSTFSQQFIDDGFHMLTLIRRGSSLEIWIDGLLDISKSVTVNSLGTTSHGHRLWGGPLYMNEWSVYTRALSRDEISIMLGGYNDRITGIATLSNQPLESSFLAVDADTGKVIKTYNTDNQGNFDILLPKVDSKLNILALAQDDNASNNVVVHGPYSVTMSSYEHPEVYVSGIGNVTVGDGVGGTASETITCDIPIEAEPGDLLIAVVAHRSDLINLGDWTIEFSQRVPPEYTDSDHQLSILSKPAQSGEAGTNVVFTQSLNMTMTGIVQSLRSDTGIFNIEAIEFISSQGTTNSTRLIPPVQALGRGRLMLGASTNTHAFIGVSNNYTVQTSNWVSHTPTTYIDARLAVHSHQAFNKEIAAGTVFCQAGTYNGVEVAISISPK